MSRSKKKHILEEKYLLEKKLYIQSVLHLLPNKNWNDRLLTKAEKECEFTTGYSSILFPGGIKEVVKFCEELQDQNMLERLKAVAPAEKIRDKIGAALKIRIKSYSQPAQLKNAAYMSNPNNLVFATKVGWHTCDIIWHYAGDQSLDHNYYTKRGLLLSAYISAIMFYLQDSSVEYVDTDLFIDTSLSNIINTFGNAKKFATLLAPDNMPIIRLFS